MTETLEQIARRVAETLEPRGRTYSPDHYIEFSRRLFEEYRKQQEPEIEYVPGEWFKAKDISEMQRFFMSRLPAIREVAREHGYAIGLHGSTRRDFDLIAMPWTEAPSDRETLAHAIQKAACGIELNGKYSWEKKPSGRYAVSMCICWADHANPEFKGKLGIGHIDLSVIEATPQPTPEEVKDAAKWREHEAKKKALIERGFLKSPLRDAAELGTQGDGK